MKTLNKKPHALILALLVTAFMSLPADAQEQIGNTNSYGYASSDTNNMLMESVRKSDIHTINTILNNGADVNEQSRSLNTALMVAAKIGDHKVVETLLAHNADPNIQNGAGATALMIAAKYGNNHVIEQLLQNGADPLIQNKSGFKATRFAYAYEHQKTYRILLDAEQNDLKGIASKAENKKTS